MYPTSLPLLYLQPLDLVKYTKSAGHYVLADAAKVEEALARLGRQKAIQVEPSCLHWQPLYGAALKKTK